MTDEKKSATFWCNACLLDVPLDQTKVTDIRTAEGERLFFAQTVHTLCGTPVQEKETKFNVAGLPPKWSETPEDVRRAADALASFTRDAYQVQVAQREEDLKEILRRAIKLVEENPPNEPMRTPVSRPAVERMLAEDLDEALTLNTLTQAKLDEVARTLFDAGWRPTIDRLVR